MKLGLSEEEKSKLKKIKTALDQESKERSRLIPLLQQVQSELSYLPREAIHILADHLGLSFADVYGVATFYNQFRFKPARQKPGESMPGNRMPR